MPYLLDANVFIQAKNFHYGMDFCPAFWDWLREQNNAGRVFSIEKVADELMDGKDELSAWAAKMGSDFFLTPDETMLNALSRVSQWVQDQHYQPAAVSAFLQGADYYLVTYALAHDHVVVTHEVASGGVKKVKIPDICIGIKVKCITPFTMLRREGARFILDSTRGVI